MVLTTRRRRIIVLTALTLAVAAITVAMMLWPPESTYAYPAGGASSMQMREIRALGLTRWLVLDRRIEARDGSSDLDFHVNAIGLMKGVLVVGLSVLAAWWLGRITCERLARRRRCDRCNYDLHMLMGTRCPECGAEVSEAIRAPPRGDVEVVRSVNGGKGT